MRVCMVCRAEADELIFTEDQDRDHPQGDFHTGPNYNHDCSHLGGGVLFLGFRAIGGEHMRMGGWQQGSPLLRSERVCSALSQ